MNLLKGLAGLTAIVVIFAAAFYAYSNISDRSSGLPAQTAIVSDSANNSELVKSESNEGNKMAVASPSTTATSRPNLDGLNENQLQEGLANIKAGLDLLQNPIE